MLNREIKDMTLNFLSIAKKGLETKIHNFSSIRKSYCNNYEGIKKSLSFKKYS